MYWDWESRARTSPRAFLTRSRTRFRSKKRPSSANATGMRTKSSTLPSIDALMLERFNLEGPRLMSTVTLRIGWSQEVFDEADFDLHRGRIGFVAHRSSSCTVICLQQLFTVSVIVLERNLRHLTQILFRRGNPKGHLIRSRLPSTNYRLAGTDKTFSRVRSQWISHSNSGRCRIPIAEVGLGIVLEEGAMETTGFRGNIGTPKNGPYRTLRAASFPDK